MIHSGKKPQITFSSDAYADSYCIIRFVAMQCLNTVECKATGEPCNSQYQSVLVSQQPAKRWFPRVGVCVTFNTRPSVPLSASIFSSDT